MNEWGYLMSECMHEFSLVLFKILWRCRFWNMKDRIEEEVELFFIKVIWISPPFFLHLLPSAIYSPILSVSPSLSLSPSLTHTHTLSLSLSPFFKFRLLFTKCAIQLVVPKQNICNNFAQKVPLLHVRKKAVALVLM